jgi:Predicted GTPases
MVPRPHDQDPADDGDGNQHVDASLVLLDARIPLSSLKPEVERITGPET